MVKCRKYESFWATQQLTLRLKKKITEKKVENSKRIRIIDVSKYLLASKGKCTHKISEMWSPKQEMHENTHQHGG